MTYPPGWYRDAQAPWLLRWWDGTQWTAHTRDTRSTAAQSQAEPRRAITAISKVLITLALCTLAGVVLAVVGILFVDSLDTPSSDDDLVALAQAMQQQLTWGGVPQDETALLPSDGELKGLVRLSHTGGAVEFRRYATMEKRKNAQTSERRPVAGCRDVLAAFDYPDANVAQAHAETALNMMTFLAAGNCDSKERATARSSTTTSEGAPSEPRRSYQLTMDSCTRDQFGFVEARGRIQNETSRSRSYYVEVEFLAESGVRIDFGNDLVPDVAPGQTAVWRAYGVVDYSGRFTCRYSAQSL